MYLDKKFIKLWQPKAGLVQYNNPVFVSQVQPTITDMFYQNYRLLKSFS